MTASSRSVGVTLLRKCDRPLALTLSEGDAAQAEKVYVQHRMREQGAALYDLIERRGGNIYVCGDGANMAKVKQTSVEQCPCPGCVAALASTVSSRRCRVGGYGCILQCMCSDFSDPMFILCLTVTVIHRTCTRLWWTSSRRMAN